MGIISQGFYLEIRKKEKSGYLILAGGVEVYRIFSEFI